MAKGTYRLCSANAPPKMKREWLVKKQQTSGVDIPVVVSGTIVVTSLIQVREIVRRFIVSSLSTCE